MFNTMVDDRPQALLGNIGLLGCNFEDGALRERVIAKSNDDGISAFPLAPFEDPKPSTGRYVSFSGPVGHAVLLALLIRRDCHRSRLP
jgi:hypothetical protein